MFKKRSKSGRRLAKKKERKKTERSRQIFSESERRQKEKRKEADQRERSMGNESSGNHDGNQMYQKDTRKSNGAERTLQNVELIDGGRQD